MLTANAAREGVKLIASPALKARIWMALLVAKPLQSLFFVL
jgi:hypothetical protein